MKIGFDAKRAAQNRTGLGNYSRFTIRILSERQPGNEYHLYTPKPKRMPYLNEIPTLDRLHLHFPPAGLWSWLRSIWRVWGITSDIRRDGIEIFHGLSGELPLNIGTPESRREKGMTATKYVVTIHDLIFLHTPEYYHWIDRKIYGYKFRRACHNADRIIAVSEFTKSEIVRYYGIDEGKIDVVYQGCDPVFAADIPMERLDEVKRRMGLPERFLLYVGSIEKRKNLKLVAQAMLLLRSGMKVVAVGRYTPYVDEIKGYLKENGMEDCFMFCHKVSYADLPAFYKLATAFVYPSRIEGFGIPMLEAISSGLPAIGCTGSCLEEAGGPGSLYVSPDSAEDMATAIERVCTDERLRSGMIAEGRRYAHNFSDEKLCDDLLKVYEKCDIPE